MIQIQKDIAVPDNVYHRPAFAALPYRGVGRPSIYPFDTMEVGESFAIPCTPETKYRIGNNVSGCAQQARPRMGGAKFTVKRTDAEVRCWRIE